MLVPPAELEPEKVRDMEDDPKAANYREASRSRRLADQFNYSYTMLLSALHGAFNGEPDQIDRAMGAKYELRFLAQQVLSTPSVGADPIGTRPNQTGAILRVSSGELMRLFAIACLAALPTAALAGGLDLGAADADGPVYPTFGVHNPPEYSDCEAPDCLVRRGPDAPSDPLYPLHWVSEWTMYRVFQGLKRFPPPYASPPKGLTEGTDYEVSQGATYYDATWSGPTGSGAMMEFYDKRCLPIFPIDNRFTCAFISLGDIAYFLTYPDDRPKEMPPCCSFSNLNHPPRRDFVKHLPYSAPDSSRVPDIQAYSLLTPGPGGNEILFGYAFETAYRGDEEAPEADDYRHPQSFYFSGEPTTPPNAPIVSQNYVNFRAIKPDPAKTWDLVGQQCTGDIPWCALFKDPQK